LSTIYAHTQAHQTLPS